MSKLKKYSVVLDTMVAISFIMNTFANVVSFYFTGNKNDMLRTVISWSIMIAVCFMLCAYVLYEFIKGDKKAKISIAACLLPAAICSILLIYKLISSSLDYDVLRQCISFSVYCISMVCGGVYMIVENRIDAVIQKFKYLVLFMLPFFVMAILFYWNLDPEAEIRTFGELTYLTIGNAAVTIYVFLLCDLIIYFVDNCSKKIKLICILFEIVLMSFVLVITGARSVMLMWIIANFFTVGFLAVKKKWKPMIGIGISIISVLALFVFRPSDNFSSARQLRLIRELEQGELLYSINSEEGKRILNEIRRYVDEGYDFYSAAKACGAVSITKGNMARPYLWQLAIIEVEEKPLSGMGIMGYQSKYKTYPHNVLLEIMTDFGIPVFIVFLFFCITLVRFFFISSKKNWFYCFITIYLCSQAVSYMLSGNVYLCTPLFFATVFFIWEIRNRPLTIEEHKIKRKRST